LPTVHTGQIDRARRVMEVKHLSSHGGKQTMQRKLALHIFARDARYDILPTHVAAGLLSCATSKRKHNGSFRRDVERCVHYGLARQSMRLYEGTHGNVSSHPGGRPCEWHALCPGCYTGAEVKCAGVTDGCGACSVFLERAKAFPLTHRGFDAVARYGAPARVK
jgi:hypothetical protein